MRKLILALGLMLSIVHTAPMMAENKGVIFDYHKKGNENNTEPDRAPMRIPTIDATYDTETGAINITCDATVDAEVFVIDANNNVVDYSSVINTVLFIPTDSNQTYTLHVIANRWQAIATIE